MYVPFWGFGAETYPALHSKFLKKAVVNLIPKEECFERIYGEKPYYEFGDGYCAIGENDEHACIGDDGDPLIWEDISQQPYWPNFYRAYLIGITARSIRAGG